ncbi:MAG: helix-turn-helix domain-containing protein [Anaerolineae bacterium]|nr:helix-turn-helix domain-containing protein [Anaerolineae bacterium]
MTDDMTLGDYIAWRRKALRLEQRELVERLKARGVDRAVTTLSGWEHNKQQVPIDFIPALAEALEVSITTLYEHAGILRNIPGSEIVKLLDGLPDEEVAKIQRMIAAYFQNAR